MSLFDPFPRDEPRPSPPPDYTKRPERRCKPCDVRWSMNDGDDCWACGARGDEVPALAYYPNTTYVHQDTGEAAPA